MEQIISNYLDSIGIPVSKKYCKRQIISHPDYPSLLSIADTLKQLGIKYQIARIDKNYLSELEFPYILQFDEQRGTLRIIENQNDLDAHKEKIEHWNGVVIKAEPTQAVTDTQHNEQYRNEKQQRRFAVTAMAALVLLLCVLLVPYASWLYGLLVLTSAVGMLTGYLLLSKDLGITFKPVETFCNAGKRTNCDRILHAKDAQLLSFFSLSDATISYFTFQLLIVGLFIPLFGSAAPFLVVLFAASLLGIPIIGYSLYYQSSVANTWCRLCLSVDGLLAAQVVILAAMMVARQEFTWGSYQIPVIFITGLVFLATASGIVLLKNRLKKANETNRQATEANRVKQNPAVFAYLLLEGDKIDTTPFPREIRVGNKQAPINVTMAINLYCGPCSRAWQEAMKLLDTHPKDVCFLVRLTKGTDNAIGGLSTSTYLIRYWQQYIYGKEDEPAQTQQLLQDWYKQMDPKTLAAQYSANGELIMENNDEEELPENNHYQWMKQVGITATPTIFVNGYRMPENYTLNDLKTLIPGFVAQIQENKMKENEEEIA